MIGPFRFNFDFFSFLLGFLTALLLSWGFSIIKQIFPRIGASIKESIKTTQVKQKSGIQKYLLQNGMLQIQGMHLVNQLFSLDEIIIQPRLIIPTYNTPDEEAYAITTIASQIIPYLPDTPELSSQYHVNSLTPIEALQEGANIVIVGEAGTGKTTALAQVTSLIMQEDPVSGKLIDHLPFYIHITDLNIYGQDELGPIGLIINYIIKQNSSFVRSRIPNCIIDAAKNGSLLLLIDGLDELPSIQFDKSVNFIEALLQQFPGIQIMTTASTAYLGELIKLGFHPLALAGWNTIDIENFIDKWNRLWIEHIHAAYYSPGSPDSIDPRVIKNWLSSQFVYLTPLQWTLKIWAAYSGELNGPLTIHAIDNYISRLSGKSVSRGALETLALEFVRQSALTLSVLQVENCLNGYVPPSGAPLDVELQTPGLLMTRHDEKPNLSLTSSGAVNTLIENGLLIKQENQQLRFCNPLITGFLASFAIHEDQIEKIEQPLRWSVTANMLKFLAAQNKAIDWIETNILNKSEAPLHLNILTVGKWISDTPVNLDWRTNFMRKALGLIATESMPFPIKARLMSIFVGSNDPSVSKLIKQLLTTNSATLKTLAALASGAMNDQKQGKELNALLSDPSQEVRNAASLAIEAITSPPNIDPIIDLLMSGDDQIRQSAAEALAFLPPRGYDILEEAASDEDLMVRKASVFGLSQVKEDWASKLLEKVSYEDKQWVVRNAAHQAAELSKKANPFIPRPLQEPSDVSWLIEFASKRGVGVKPGEFPREILLSCLFEGTLDEKIDTLAYLVRYPDFEVVNAIYKLVDANDRSLVEASINALWQINASGLDDIPDYNKAKKQIQLSETA